MPIPIFLDEPSRRIGRARPAFFFCCDCDECDECPCSSDNCWQIDDPPELAVCSADADALAAFTEAMTGVLRNIGGVENCLWWKNVCHEIDEDHFIVYSVNLTAEGSGCIPHLYIRAACVAEAVDVCCEAASLPGDYPIVAHYVCNAGFDACGTLTFTLVEDFDLCGECEHAPDVTWPETLTVIPATCDDATPGGSECEEELIDCCRSCGNVLPTTLYLTFGTATNVTGAGCPLYDGKTFTMRFVESAVDVNGTPFESFCDSFKFGNWISDEIVDCAGYRKHRIVVTCLQDCAEHPNGWAINPHFFTDVSGSGFCQLSTGIQSTSCSCVPLSVFWASVFITNGLGCDCCPEPPTGNSAIDITLTA